MSCRLCQSESQHKFPSEINIHFPGRENLTKPTVWVFPKLVLCLDCGFTEFIVEEKELGLLKDGTEAQNSSSARHTLALDSQNQVFLHWK